MGLAKGIADPRLFHERPPSRYQSQIIFYHSDACRLTPILQIIGR